MRCIAVVFILFCLCSCGIKKTELVLNLEKGKSYRQSMASNVTLTQTINGTKVPMSAKSDALLSYYVRSKDGNTYNLDVVYKSLDLIMEVNETRIEFSSEKRDNKDMVSTILSEMKNKPFRVKMSTAGKLLEVNNIENLFSSLFNKFPNLPEEQKQALREKLMESFGSEKLKGNLEMSMPVFPADPVAPGETWVAHSYLEAPFASRIRTTYTYTATDSGYHNINGDGTLESADQAFTMVNGVPTRFDVKGSVKSIIRVDKKTGWIVSGTVTQDIAGDSYVRTIGAPHGFRVPMEMKNVTLIRNN